MNQSRVPAGITTGGQFAAEPRSEAALELPAPKPTDDHPEGWVTIGKTPAFGWRAMSPEQADTAHSYLVGLVDEANAEEQWEEAALYAQGAALVREAFSGDFSAPAPAAPAETGYGWRSMSPEQADTAYQNLERLAGEANAEEQWEEAALYAHLALQVSEAFPGAGRS